MNTEFWISELGRLYVRSTEAINEEQTAAVKPLSDEFNETLSKLKNDFPDTPIVSSTNEVDPFTNTGFVPERVRDGALHEIRSRCEKMANAIGYELPEPRSGSRSPDQMVMVSVDSRQETTQEVTVEAIQQMIQTLPRPPEAQAELQQLVEEFENEVAGEQDQSKLRQLLTKASEISTDVAAQMAVFGLKHGATAVLGLH